MDNYPHYIHVVAVNWTLLELLGTESIGGIGGYRDLSQLPEHY